ncbi:MAG: sulfite exporter TauE/SafE family protein [Polyangiaceae bacterium]|nr:sulfite exporter TauE/SafE family protein [Polyangiaceae bacterium]
MHAPTAWQLAILALVGAVAGFVNTVAGAGSLLSLRALMLFGLPATIANGTNRVPVVAQSIAATLGFAKHGRLPRRAIAWAAAPASLGALAGSLGASFVPERPMRWVLIVVLFAVGVWGLRSPKVPERAGELDDDAVLARCRDPKVVVWLFFAGAYGGFLQAGVGLILLHALSSVGGIDLVRANALKVVVVAVFSVVAASVFIARGQVAWVAALAMTVGAVVGARLAVAYAIGWAQKLKIVVVVVDLVACAVLLLTEL